MSWFYTVWVAARASHFYLNQVNVSSCRFLRILEALAVGCAADTAQNLATVAS